jgi:RNA polymerase sigma-70 factor (ECF subfamily)
MRMEATLSTEAQPLDKQALVRVYEDYSPGMYRYAYRLLGDQDLAEECVAETFTRFLHVIRRGGNPTGNLQASLYRMAHNWVVDYYRKQTPNIPLEEDTHPDPDGDIENRVHTRQEMEQLRNALLQLTYEQQTVIELRFMEDWSHDKVAEFLGKTVDATRALQYRALATLHESMKDHEEDNDG